MLNNSRSLLLTLAIVGLLVLVAGGALADNPGAGSYYGSSAAINSNAAGTVEFTTLRAVLQSGLLLGIGVLAAAYGAYLWLVKQQTGPGITLLVVSALIALTPNLMDGFKKQFCPAIESLGGVCGSLSYADGYMVNTNTPQTPAASGDVAIINGIAQTTKNELQATSQNVSAKLGFAPLEAGGEMPFAEEPEQPEAGGEMPTAGGNGCGGKSYLMGMVCTGN